MNKNEIKKELFKTKVNAKFSHYCSGNLYYTVEVLNNTYQFPISTVDSCGKEQPYIVNGSPSYNLSSDLGTTTFYNEIRGSELNRWIDKAIDNGDFVKIK